MKPNEVKDWEKEWKKVEFFESLVIVGFHKGAHSVNVMAKSVMTDEYYNIFLTDFVDMVRSGNFHLSLLEGEFIVRKRGRAFGIRLKKTPELDTVDYYKTREKRPIPEQV